MGPHVRIPFIDFMSNRGERRKTFNLIERWDQDQGQSQGLLPSLYISSRQTYFSSFCIHQIHPELLSEYNFLQYDQPDLYDSRSGNMEKVELNNISAGLAGPSYCSDWGPHHHHQGEIF